jgi:hypothetical protein
MFVATSNLVIARMEFNTTAYVQIIQHAFLFPLGISSTASYVRLTCQNILFGVQRARMRIRATTVFLSIVSVHQPSTGIVQPTRCDALGLDDDSLTAMWPASSEVC